ncbi:5'-nucleotidase C-terminal domain-containing protein [Lacinutrix undariae]
MNFKYLFLTFFVISLTSCKQENNLYRIEGKLVPITDSITTDKTIDNFIKPFRENLEKNMNTPLSYSVDTYTKRGGEYNTAIGNMMADAVYEEANPIFNKRTNENIDFVILNHGGIRSILSKGVVTTKTAYEIMPFENSIVVTSLKGAQIKEMFKYLAKARRSHPVHGFKLALTPDFEIASATTTDNTPIDYEKNYFVATNDYLYNGGDHMDFFKTNDSLYVLDYKIRNALIDYFTKKDTLNPVIDDRFIQLK